jgi:AbrB family looped-hinge helix DNA binding protein
MLSTVTDKGQVTLPKPIRDQLGIRAGTRFGFQSTPVIADERSLRGRSDGPPLSGFNPRPSSLTSEALRAQVITAEPISHNKARTSPAEGRVGRHGMPESADSSITTSLCDTREPSAQTYVTPGSRHVS